MIASMFSTVIAPWRGNAEAALTISFDDSYKDTCDFTIETLLLRGFRATYNVATSYVDDFFEGRRIASWSDLREAWEKGMEIGAHSISHRPAPSPVTENLKRMLVSLYNERFSWYYITHIAESLSSHRASGLPPSEIPQEVAESKQTIECKIPSCKVLSYAYPDGLFNGLYQWHLRSAGYLNARSTIRGFNQQFDRNFYALKSVVLDGMTSEAANNYVCRAIKKRAWLIEVYHLVADENQMGYRGFTKIESFLGHLKFLDELKSRLWIDTQQNISAYMITRNCSKVSCLSHDQSTLELGIISTAPQNHNKPITLVTRIPDNWSNIFISQNGDYVAYGRRSSTVYYDAYPNKGSIIIERSGK